jgi:Ni/Fe-hydrogenase subunit HybB-like protein
MWSLILNFLGGPIVSGLLSAYKARLQSINSDDQRALQLLEAEIAADTAARAEATRLLIAEQGHWYTAIVRPLFAAPFIVFGFKVVIWDKVLGWGVTDRLDPNMWAVFQTIVVSYFGATAVERVARIFKR